MGSKQFFITGATGHTGGETARRLLEHGHRVKLLVHHENDRSAQLQTLGAEIVVGDLLDFMTIRPALQGVAGAYFVYPITPGLVEATACFAQAAKEANVPAVVNMSQISARRQANSHAAFNHWVAEQIMDWSGLGVTHVHPTFFAENLYTLDDRGIKVRVVRQPFGEGKHAPIAAEDQARLVAIILENPSEHKGKTYRLFGPKEYSHAEAYQKISQILGSEIKYERVPYQEFYEQVVEAGLSPCFAQHIVEVAKDHESGIFSGTDQVIEEITGQKPMDLETLVRKHLDAFER